MALDIKQKISILQNNQKIFTVDATGNIEEGSWGYDLNPNREDVALIFFCEYIDNKDNLSILEQETQIVDGNTDYAIADGEGLSNTDMSIFTTITNGKEGHFIFNMIPILRDSTKVEAGATNEVYYNTDDNRAYIYDGSWIKITRDHFPTLKQVSGASICEDILFFKKLQTRQGLLFDWAINNDDYSDEEKEIEKKLQYLRIRLSVIRACIYERMSVGRKLLANTKDF